MSLSAWRNFLYVLRCLCAVGSVSADYRRVSFRRVGQGPVASTAIKQEERVRACVEIIGWLGIVTSSLIFSLPYSVVAADFTTL
jgi:hypothetical protein